MNYRVALPFTLIMAMQNAFSLHFVSYGDTRTYPNSHQIVIDAVAKVNPEMIAFSGDLWDGYTSAQWKTIVNSNANIATLLTNNKFVVARGNHETEAEVLAFTPTLVRNNSARYSFTEGDCFFVCLAMDPSAGLTFLETELKSAPAKAAKWRIVLSHYAPYNDGSHGGDVANVPRLDSLCSKYNVSLFLSGHDHNYQRTHQLFNTKVVDQSNLLTYNKGTVYLVSGGGGAPLYTRSQTSAYMHSFTSTNNYLDITTSPTMLTVRAMKVDLSTKAVSPLDSFVINAADVAIDPLGPSTGGGLSFSASLILSTKRVALSFPAIIGASEVLEIRSLTGDLVFSQKLVPNQQSLLWDYSKQAPGEYVAVLSQGETSTSTKISIKK